MMDKDNNQEFDLEDILKEFSDHPDTESAQPEDHPEQMPELRFDPEPWIRRNFLLWWKQKMRQLTSLPFRSLPLSWICRRNRKRPSLPWQSLPLK